MRALASALCLLLPAQVAVAAELRSIELEREGDRFIGTAEVWLDAPTERVFEVMADWDLSTKFSSLIVESRDLDPGPDGRPGFYMKNKGCVLFFCKTFEREGSVEREPYERISATADPEKSDFHMSEEVWQFEQTGDGTLVDYRIEMNPKFWVPPVIGPYAIKKKIRKDGVEALRRIEDYIQNGRVGDD